MISQQQTGSVPGRNIFAALNLTRDLLQYTNLTGGAGLFLSLEQANAFDRVSHKYSYATLEAQGYPQNSYG